MTLQLLYFGLSEPFHSYHTYSVVLELAIKLFR